MKEFHSQERLEDIVKELSNPDLNLERDKNQVNELVLNIVTKYNARYLNLNESNFEEIRRGIQISLNERGPEVGEMFSQMITGDLGKTDIFAIQCAADLHSTSAIFKEIVSQGSRDTNKEIAINLDFGSGTGILTLAAHIHSKRNNFQSIFNIGYDNQRKSVLNSKRVLGSLLDKDEYMIQQLDVRKKELYKHLASIDLQKFINNWISETIGFTTPKLGLKGEVIMNNEKDIFLAFFNDISSDPFPLIAENTIRYIPNFIKRVEKGDIQMFPDFINGKYIPDENNSKINLTSSSVKGHRLLSSLGDEYKEFSTLQNVHRRW